MGQMQKKWIAGALLAGFAWGSPSYAGYPQSEDMARVNQLATSIQRDSTTLWSEAQRFADPRDLLDAQALSRAQSFARASQKFTDSAQSFAARPQMTEPAFLELKASFELFQSSATQLRAYPTLLFLIQRLSSDFSTLSEFYLSSPDPDWSEVRRIARELKWATSRAYQAADREARPPYDDPLKRSALFDVDDLRMAALRFEKAVAMTEGDSADVRAAYDRLSFTYRRADASVWRAGFSSMVRNAMYQVETQLRRLDVVYHGNGPIPPG